MTRRKRTLERSSPLAPLAGVLLSLLVHGAIAASLWLRSGASDADPAPRLAGIRAEEPLRIRWVPSGPPRPAAPPVPAREESLLAPLSPGLDGAPPRPGLPDRPPLAVPAPPEPTIAGPAAPAPPDPLAALPPPEPEESSPPPRPAAAVSARTGPVLIDPVVRVYPRSCLVERHEGVVELLLQVDPRGQVTAARVVAKSPCRELDEAARRGALRLRYEPAREAGEAVAGEARLAVKFVLER